MAYLQVGKHRLSATIQESPEHIEIDFAYSSSAAFNIIKDEVKVLAGARWNPGKKCWTVKNDQGNKFALAYLQGQNVFDRYDKPLEPFAPSRKEVYDHQATIVSHMLTRRGCIVAAEMGAGKTLASIELLEHLSQLYNPLNAWYVGPKTANLSVRLEYSNWKSRFYPQFYTLQDMVKLVSNWESGKPPPQVVIFDESSRLKSPDAKQSQCALHLANAVRDYWGDKGYIILMTGSPAPKSPMDWWMQCEIACPGFLRERTPRKFLDRIALVKKMTGESGIAWPKILTFRDDVNKCGVCGRLSSHDVHTRDQKKIHTYTAGRDEENELHEFVAMANEVETMYARLNGIALVVLKKNCLQLPEKVYRSVKCKPTKYYMSLSKMARKTAPNAASALNIIRQLSDGFQYTEEPDGHRDCEHCLDKFTGKPTGVEFIAEGGDGEEVLKEITCRHCAGKKQFKKFKDAITEMDSPKFEALTNELENLEEEGRVVIFGSFQALLDRICTTVVKAGWRFIRKDGRGWYSDLDTKDPESLLKQFQRKEECKYERIAFIAHPKSAGMGLTLTASDTIIYVDNDFDAESRIQSEDRIHRPGCRGANIVDLLHDPVDQYVLDNLKKKRDMQSITMGEIERVMEEADEREFSSS